MSENYRHQLQPDGEGGDVNGGLLSRLEKAIPDEMEPETKPNVENETNKTSLND